MSYPLVMDIPDASLNSAGAKQGSCRNHFGRLPTRDRPSKVSIISKNSEPMFYRIVTCSFVLMFTCRAVDNFSGPSLRDIDDGTAGSLMPEATNSLNSPYHLAVGTSTNEVECHLNEKGSRVDLMFSAPPNYLEKQKQGYNSRETIEPKLNKGNYHGRDPIATFEMTSKSSNKFQKSSDYAKSKSST
ncbi:hypothetical protein PGT21_014097 [Puccinia graminis f. sp. tritici]|uniref:Uncharacterized protein n=1 Tax=Puccinia graminis f. sp. tritici TaxID=56615 RepID=A0A5B0NLB6_PUCGR|nr:hypothetical protein PGT21_014097 [Puccinia graminis f. sp. tritici]